MQSTAPVSLSDTFPFIPENLDPVLSKNWLLYRCVEEQRSNEKKIRSFVEVKNHAALVMGMLNSRCFDVLNDPTSAIPTMPAASKFLLRSISPLFEDESIISAFKQTDIQFQSQVFTLILSNTLTCTFSEACRWIHFAYIFELTPIVEAFKLQICADLTDHYTFDKMSKEEWFISLFLLSMSPSTNVCSNGKTVFIADTVIEILRYYYYLHDDHGKEALKRACFEQVAELNERLRGFAPLLPNSRYLRTVCDLLRSPEGMMSRIAGFSEYEKVLIQEIQKNLPQKDYHHKELSPHIAESSKKIMEKMRFLRGQIMERAYKCHALQIQYRHSENHLNSNLYVHRPIFYSGLNFHQLFRTYFNQSTRLELKISPCAPPDHVRDFFFHDINMAELPDPMACRYLVGWKDPRDLIPSRRETVSGNPPDFLSLIWKKSLEDPKGGQVETVSCGSFSLNIDLIDKWAPLVGRYLHRHEKVKNNFSIPLQWQEVFKFAIYFLYTGSLPSEITGHENELEYLFKLIAFAKEFDIKPLKGVCQIAIVKLITQKTILADTWKTFEREAVQLQKGPDKVPAWDLLIEMRRNAELLKGSPK